MAKTRRTDTAGRAGQRRRHDLIRRELPICWLCGNPIDTTLPGTDDYGPSRHHAIPVARGGHPTHPDNERLTHRICNTWAGDRLPDDARRHVHQRWAERHGHDPTTHTDTTHTRPPGAGNHCLDHCTCTTRCWAQPTSHTR